MISVSKRNLRPKTLTHPRRDNFGEAPPLVGPDHPASSEGCYPNPRSRANVAHPRQSVPNSGLGSQVKFLTNSEVVPSSLGSGPAWLSKHRSKPQSTTHPRRDNSEEAPPLVGPSPPNAAILTFLTTEPRGDNFKGFKLEPEIQGQNLTLTLLFAPSSRPQPSLNPNPKLTHDATILRKPPPS